MAVRRIGAPIRVPSTHRLMQSASDAMQKLLVLAQAELARPTATWRHDVQWETRLEQAAGNLTGAVGTNDRIYGFQDGGTAPHAIGGSPLVFRLGSAPKTPGFVSQARGGSGRVVTDVVAHPGTLAQNWSKQAETAMAPIVAELFGDLEIYD